MADERQSLGHYTRRLIDQNDAYVVHGLLPDLKRSPSLYDIECSLNSFNFYHYSVVELQKSVERIIGIIGIEHYAKIVAGTDGKVNISIPCEVIDHPAVQRKVGLMFDDVNNYFRSQSP